MSLSDGLKQMVDFIKSGFKDNTSDSTIDNAELDSVDPGFSESADNGDVQHVALDPNNPEALDPSDSDDDTWTGGLSVKASG